MEEYTILVDSVDKEDAIAILDTIGIDINTYINMAIKKLIYKGDIPFSVKTPKPSKELLDALEEGEKILNGEIESVGYNNIDDLIKSLNSE